MQQCIELLEEPGEIDVRVQDAPVRGVRKLPVGRAQSSATPAPVRAELGAIYKDGAELPDQGFSGIRRVGD